MSKRREDRKRAVRALLHFSRIYRRKTRWLIGVPRGPNGPWTVRGLHPGAIPARPPASFEIYDDEDQEIDPGGPHA